ncbi:MAG: ATPase [Anaerolineae bacterium]|nr:ATPase [Anaerolineae bacterium]
MSAYFLGVDIGGTKSHALIADASGRAVGFGEAGPGNYEDVGYDGLAATLAVVTQRALADAGITKEQIAGAGFGIAGYDWPSQREPHLAAIRPLGLDHASFELVNDTIIGLLTGAPSGWGIAVIAGTRANCWGWDQNRRIGRLTGYGWRMAEVAGGLELVGKAIQSVALAWTRRGPATRLTQAFIEWTGARDIEDLLEGLSLERLQVDASAAPLVFQAAAKGDLVAQDIILWAGRELGSLAIGVIRQLNFEALEFDAVLVGSLYKGSPLLVEAMRQTVYTVAPGARFTSLSAPPVVGGVLLGMEQAGLNAPTLRETLIQSSMELLSTRSIS